MRRICAAVSRALLADVRRTLETVRELSPKAIFESKESPSQGVDGPRLASRIATASLKARFKPWTAIRRVPLAQDGCLSNHSCTSIGINSPTRFRP
jgi:hypothetical protein